MDDALSQTQDTAPKFNEPAKDGTTIRVVIDDMGDDEAFEEYHSPRTVRVNLGSPVMIGRASSHRSINQRAGPHNAFFRCQMMSRHHARLSTKTGAKGVLYIEDLKSMNGTRINGVRIPPHELIEVEDGDSVTFAADVAQSSGVLKTVRTTFHVAHEPELSTTKTNKPRGTSSTIALEYSDESDDGFDEKNEIIDTDVQATPDDVYFTGQETLSIPADHVADTLASIGHADAKSSSDIAPQSQLDSTHDSSSRVNMQETVACPSFDHIDSNYNKYRLDADTDAGVASKYPIKPFPGLMRLPHIDALNLPAHQDIPDVLRAEYYTGNDEEVPDYVPMPVLKSPQEVEKQYVSKGQGEEVQGTLTQDENRCNAYMKYIEEMEQRGRSPSFSDRRSMSPSWSTRRSLSPNKVPPWRRRGPVRNPYQWMPMRDEYLGRSPSNWTTQYGMGNDHQHGSSEEQKRVAISNLVNKEPVAASIGPNPNKRKACVLEEDDIDQPTASMNTINKSVTTTSANTGGPPAAKHARTAVATVFNMTACALAGSVATFGFLCSPLAERLLQT